MLKHYKSQYRFETHNKPSEKHLLMLLGKALYLKVILDNDHNSIPHFDDG